MVQLSFHEGLGDHHTVLVDITTHSAIGKHDFKVVRPEACRLNSTNTRVRSRYILYLEGQMSTHRMTERLDACGQTIASFPTSKTDKRSMQILDTQMEDMQRGSKTQCRQIFLTAVPFSEPVRTYHYRHRAYQGLLKHTMLAIHIGTHCTVASPH